MNRHLANFIFANETLYDVPIAVPHVAPQLRSEVIKKNEIVEATPQEILPQKHENIFTAKSKLVVIVNSISSREKEFLAKIIGAVGFDINKIDLVEIEHTQLPDYQSFISNSLTKKTLIFGVTFTKIGWSQMLPLYQTKTFGNIDFLFYDELSKIEANLDLKKSLWANLQKLFPKKV